MVEHVHKVTEIHDETNPVASGMVFLARIIYFIFGVIIAFLILRMALLLLGANQANSFVSAVYGISGIFTAPFYGIFNNTPVLGASVFDISSLVAIVVYALISWALGALVSLGLRDREEI
jgi:hypothetical protein